MKNATLPLAVGISVIACALAVYANLRSSELKIVLDQERGKRFAVEQKLLSRQQEVTQLQSQLGEEKSKTAAIQKILTDGKAVEEEMTAKLEALEAERKALAESQASLQKKLEAQAAQPAADAPAVSAAQ